MTLQSSLVKSILYEDYQFEIPTSMIDVVFLLLLFFIAGTKMRLPEQKLDTKLPNEGPAPFRTSPIPPPQYNLYVDGTDSAQPVYMLNRLPVRDVNELAFKLRSVAAASPDCSVLVVGRNKTPFKYIISALDACRQADISDVKFQTLPQQILTAASEGM